MPKQPVKIAARDFAGASYRPNLLEVDLGAITGNVTVLRRLVGPGTMLFGAVKANGYGFGLPAVASAMLAGGVDAFAMADPADAIRIRDAGIEVPLLLYGGVMPERRVARLLSEYDLTCTIGDIEGAQAWSRIGIDIKAFLKIDVGLERLGAPAEQALPFAAEATLLPHLRIGGIYTHLHGGESATYLSWQLDRFDRALAQLDEAAIEMPVRLAESSATLGLGQRSRLNAVDPGHLLYGLVPAGRTEAPSGIRPAAISLKTRIIQVKTLSRPGYPEGAPVTLHDGMRLAILPLGRADGLSSLTTGQVLVRGHRVPIVGRMSLEHTRIDVTQIPNCRAGDEVVVIGRQRQQEISFDEVAARHGLDLLDLVLESRPSIQRVYRHNTA
jgi:alanine racemase